jgi:subtilisin family serine protease
MILAAILLLPAMWLLSGCGGSSAGGSLGGGSTPVAGAPTSPAADALSAPNNADGTKAVLVVFKQNPGQMEAAAVSNVAGRVKQRFSLIPALSADLKPEAITKLQADPTVACVEPDAIAHASADIVEWDVKAVNAPQVWATKALTGVAVKVAVIDTGMDYTHPDLKPNYKGGYNFYSGNTSPMDDNGHGTHVSGTVAAAINGSGIEGVAPHAALYALKVLGADGSGSYSNIIAALEWCVTNHMQVASMSFGSPTNSSALQSACNAAVAAGVTLVAAAGNSGNAAGTGNNVDYPALFSSVIAVSAVDQENKRPWWSSTGPKVEIAAPGVNITSDKLGGGLVVMNGTSMATPHVSGVCALIIASGVKSPAAVRQRLDSTCTDLGVAGRDPLFGYGLVNALKAVSPAVVASK